MRKIFLIIFCLILSISCLAQSLSHNHENLDPLDKKNQLNLGKGFGMYSYMGMEYNFINDRTMIASLHQNGFNARDLPNFSFLFGYQYYFNRVQLDLSYSLSDNLTNTNTYKASSRYRSFRVALGYNVLPSMNYVLAPYVGIKSAIFRYKYSSWNDQSFTFDDYFAQNWIEQEIKSSRINFDLGIGVSFQQLMLTQVRAGYLIPLDKQSWFTKNSSEPLLHSPVVMNQFYIAIIIGLGSIFPENKSTSENYNIFASNESY